MTKSDIQLPTILASRYVKYIVGFAVAVGVGLAPFLGVVQIQAYQALLEIFDDFFDRQTLIAFSTFLMGVIAVAIQFYAGERISRRAIRRRFTAALAALLIGLFTLFSLYQTKVVPVSFSDLSDQPLIVVLGWSRSDDCPCPPSDSIGQIKLCLEGMQYDPGPCWPGNRGVKLAMMLAYLLLMGGFAALVGLLLLQEEIFRRQRQAQAVKRRESEANTPPASTSQEEEAQDEEVEKVGSESSEDATGP